ncbi:MAG: N-acetylmuramic acid 6-phosphate etherase [Armatimonadetes bacterium]|nr:N-acetylmuramic acid 6-phosphate etherase [Armatimonadota bacterium]
MKRARRRRPARSVRVRPSGRPRPPDLPALTVPALLRRIHREDRRVAPAVGRVLHRVAAAVDIIVDALRRGGRLIYVGAGSSGRLALLDALEVPPTFGVSPDLVQAVLAGGVAATVEATSPLEDDADLGRAEMRRRRVGRGDVVVAVAASGATPFTLGAVAAARRRGARTIGLTTTPGSPLAKEVEIAIVPAVGEEVLRGSTRMKAGTAQKLVLNMLSTAAMVRLGHVYGDRMVDVKPLNEKLRRRATAVVAAAAGISEPEAGQALAAAGGEAKVALVMVMAGVTAKAARRLLAEGEGFVGEALRLARRTS